MEKTSWIFKISILLGFFVLFNLFYGLYRTIHFDNGLTRAEISVTRPECHQSPVTIEWTNPDLVDECEQTGDWVALGDQAFFKKTANFFLIDLNLIVINYLRDFFTKPPKFLFQLTINTSLNGQPFQATYKLTKYELFHVEKFFMRSNFESQTIAIRFQMPSELSSEQTSPEMTLTVFDLNLSQVLGTPLKLKAKYSPHKSHPLGTAVCNKMVFIDTEKEFDQLRLWVEVNRLLGYEKLIVYLRPGFEIYPKLGQYIKINRNFIEIKPTVCLPNLISTRKQRFFTELSQFGDPQDPVFRSLSTTSYIYLLECYLDHFDQFEFIVGKDADEFFIPMRSHEVSLDKILPHFEFGYGKTPDLRKKLEQALGKLSPTSRSVLLPYGQFVKNENFDRFCFKFKEKLANFSAKNDLLLFDQDMEAQNEIRLRIWIDSKNASQVEHASRLCAINERYVKPLMLQSKHLNPHLVNFYRFFSIYNWRGKSAHETSNVLSMSLHSAIVGYNFSDLFLFESSQMVQEMNHTLCSSECGYVAHFRNTQRIIYWQGRRMLRILENGIEKEFENIEGIFFDAFWFNIISRINLVG